MPSTKENTTCDRKNAPYDAILDKSNTNYATRRVKSLSKVALVAIAVLSLENSCTKHICSAYVGSTSSLNMKLRSYYRKSNSVNPFIFHCDLCQNDKSLAFPSALGSKSSSVVTLHTKKEDNDEEERANFMMSVVPPPLVALVTQMQSKMSSIIPPILVEYVKAAIQNLPTLKVAFFSFVSGLILAVCAIIVPVYTQLDYLEEPVTLFETILKDIKTGYVDEVDTQKLFETGVSAMLNSLDPYTEFEGRNEAQDMNENVNGKYAGVGLVISGNTLPENEMLTTDTNDADNEDLDDVDNDKPDLSQTREKIRDKVEARGIRVVSAFEGYAFDSGMRVGDKLVAIDNNPITPIMTVEEVRNQLRGEPGTSVSITFERDGVDGRTTVDIPRKIVRMRTVKLATMLKGEGDGIGYVQLSNFAQDSGLEMRKALLYLQQSALEASGGETGLKGLVLDLRGNPGGLLTSAVDVASLLVPKNSDIVFARGRGFPAVLYRSRVEPLLSPDTKLAVLINGGTASAAEIVSGAVQDLDVGVVMGSDRSYGKGLVQNVEELPFQTALKFTVAKYYTPSGRCIQSTEYKEGGGSGTAPGNAVFKASKVKEEDKSVFYTKAGRVVKDGGGIEADIKVAAPSASALEVTLLRSGVINDFAAEWSKNYRLPEGRFEVSDDLYREFQKFVNTKQENKEIKLEALYSSSLNQLKKILKQSGYKGSQRELEVLQASIVREVQRDFERYKTDIKEDIGQAILSRYLPESMLIERGLSTDVQVNAAAKLLRSTDGKFDKILARNSVRDNFSQSIENGKRELLSSASTREDDLGVKLQMKW